MALSNLEKPALKNNQEWNSDILIYDNLRAS